MREREAFGDEASTKPGARLKKVGGGMVGLCVACLIAGRAVVSLFFPESRGQGITPEMWFVLVPIWSLGVVGLVLLLVGWLRGKSA